MFIMIKICYYQCIRMYVRPIKKYNDSKIGGNSKWLID